MSTSSGCVFSPRPAFATPHGMLNTAPLAQNMPTDSDRAFVPRHVPSPARQTDSLDLRQTQWNAPRRGWSAVRRGGAECVLARSDILGTNNIPVADEVDEQDWMRM
jgi:hypothetical protein